MSGGYGAQKAAGVGRACRSKRDFKSKAQAEAVIRGESWMRPGRSIYAYKCPCCPCWHLTHKGNWR